MSKIAIVNGRIFDPSQNLDKKAALLISGGEIEKIVSGKANTDDYDVIDARGMVVAPGFIDVHTHLREPGFEYREDIESGQKAAACGGFTTILCMANTNPVNDNPYVTARIVARAREVGLINVHPVGAITKNLAGEELAGIGEMVEEGCVAISDDGMPVMHSRLMRHAMEYAKSFHVPVITHAEDKHLSEGGCMNEGSMSTKLGLKGIPAAAEESMIARDILLSKLTDHHLHVAHVSTATGIGMIARAKKEGLKVTCEVTPHHLTLTEVACDHYNADAKVNPPLRTEADCRALIRAANDGTVDCIATDHAPHSRDEKDVGFGCANFGFIGMETALPVLLTLVHTKKITLKTMIALLTHGPARIFGLKGGSLKKGEPADVTIFDPNKKITVEATRFHSKSQNSPYDGAKLKGKVLFTLCNGRVVYAAV